METKGDWASSCYDLGGGEGDWASSHYDLGGGGLGIKLITEQVLNGPRPSFA